MKYEDLRYAPREMARGVDLKFSGGWGWRGFWRIVINSESLSNASRSICPLVAPYLVRPSQGTPLPPPPHRDGKHSMWMGRGSGGLWGPVGMEVGASLMSDEFLSGWMRLAGTIIQTQDFGEKKKLQWMVKAVIFFYPATSIFVDHKG